MLKLRSAWLPASSVAVHVTGVVWTLKKLPEGGAQLTVTSLSTVSAAGGVSYSTDRPPGEAVCSVLDGDREAAGDGLVAGPIDGRAVDGRVAQPEPAGSRG